MPKKLLSEQASSTSHV